MGRLLLIARLALRDLRRRRAETALLTLAILAATTTLTLGLVLRDAAGDPYMGTRTATNGPDIVAVAAAPAGLDALATADGVIDHSGPFPVAAGRLRASDRESDVQIVGRDSAPVSVDQPGLLHGTWVRDGGAVLEAAFAAALGIGVGDPVTVNGRSFEVVGVAVTAASAPYPGTSCVVLIGCMSGPVPDDAPAGLLRNPGLIWFTQADVRQLSPEPSYVMNLKLADPDQAQAFAEAYAAPNRTAAMLQSWNEILAQATEVAGDSQILLLIGAWLLGLLAVAGISVLAGGRMADQTRRVGLLKAVGGTPTLMAAVLLAEYVLVAVAAAAAGLALGSLTAPLLTEPGSGLIGSAAAARITGSTIAVVTAVAVGVAAMATAFPVWRAARHSTVDALADAPRTPRRVGWLISLSARLPVPLLLALRVAARQPRRTVLGIASIAITVSGIYVALILSAFLSGRPDVTGYDQAQAALLRHVLGVWMVVLLVLAAVNAIVITWATVLDNRHSSALSRALGATPRDVTAALAAAQVVPALLGAVLGVFPGGVALFAAITAITGGDSERATLPSQWQVLAVVGATVFAVAVLTAVPARLGARRSVTESLQAEHA